MGTDRSVPLLLRGRYEVKERLARGARGGVVRAFDHQHNRDVALRIRPAAVEDRDRVLAEAWSMLSLRPHPSLQVVREGFFEGNDYILVLDWVEGPSLAQVVADQGDPGLAPSVALDYLDRLAQALDHLHAHRPPVVHGEVTPDHAVLTADGQVVLVGVGRLGTRIPSGTPTHLAPEVVAGAAPSPAADVWALAATAVVLLTGSPFQPDRLSWEGLDPGTAGALDRAIRRGLAAEPVRRPASAGELIERLRKALWGPLPTGVVTFCLTDIQGSTPLWDAHPEVMGEVVARSEAIIAEAVEEARGRLIKARGEGDSTFSVFPRATDAALAAVTLQQALAAETWPEGIDLRVRVALHTGEAELREGDYYGPTLNRAARLRELAHGGQVLCSRAAAELIAAGLPDGAALVEVGERRLRSLSRPEFVYLLAYSVPPVPDRPSASLPSTEVDQPLARPGSGTAFVGRRQEWAEMRAGLAAAAGGRGQLLLVSGEAGIGKSRLVTELAGLAPRASARVLWGRCYEGEALPGFWPWVEVVRALVEGQAGKRLIEGLGTSAAFLAQIVPEVKEILPDLEPAPLLDAETARFRLYDSVTRLLLHLAADAPVVVILEDLHWADPASLRLLTYLAPRLKDAAILLVGTYRPGLTPDHPLATVLAGLARETVMHRIVLEGLRREDVDSILADATGSRSPEALVRAMHRRTRGNPFFVIELLRLIESLGGALSAEAVWASEVPAGVQDVVRQRVARLPEAASRLLTVAAVVGEEFSLDLIADCVDSHPQEALALVEAALATGIVREVPHQPGWFSFSHALVRETLYDGLTALRRAYIHRRVGEALEREADTGGGDILIELAHHFYRAAPAGVGAKAFSYAVRASDQAMRRFAFDQAEEQLRRALELVETMPPGLERSRAELSVRLRLIYHIRGQATPESGETATRAWELARDVGDAEGLLGSLWNLAAFHVMSASYTAAEGLGRELLKVADASDPTAAWAGHLALGLVATYRGEFPAAWDHFDQAIPLTDSLHDPFWVVNTLHPSVIARGHAALVLHVLGDDEGAAALVSDNLRIAEQLAHPLGLAYCHYWAAWVEVLRRDAAAARPHVEEAIALSTKMGFALPLPLSRVVRGWALAELGEPEAGLAEIHEALAAQGGMRFKVGLDFNLALLAQACSRAGRVEEALDAVDEALAEEEATGALLWQAELLRLRGELLWALSPERMEEAESNLRRAIEVATEQGAASLRTRAEASLRQLFGSQ